jgi:adenine-specific DNA-methyltransferase
MQNLLKDLHDLLAQDARLISQDGALLKNLVIELGLKLDPDLLRLMLSHERIKRHFFADVDGVLLFDKDKFLRFVNSKDFLPDSYTAFKNKIGLSDDDGDTYLSRRREVTLAWPYKDCVLEGGQTREDAQRDEVFWNTTLASDDIDRLLDPKALTGWRRHDAEGEHAVTDLRPDDNLIIKGNNLLALHSLARRFGGKVKLIYIDPPYNTGGSTDTFAYNNSFDHSTWLTFMRNRLEVAWHLLRKDGFIAITIDHVELFYLGALADEIFGRENRIGLVTIVHNPKGRNLAKFFSPNSEFMLVYAKNINTAEFEQVAIDEDVRRLDLSVDPNGLWTEAGEGPDRRSHPLRPIVGKSLKISPAAHCDLGQELPGRHHALAAAAVPAYFGQFFH